jgi:hypothetical protein
MMFFSKKRVGAVFALTWWIQKTNRTLGNGLVGRMETAAKSTHEGRQEKRIE